MPGSTSSKQKSQQQSTSTNTINPQQLAMLQGNYQTAQNNAATLTPYTGALTAGFTPTQTQAQGVLSAVGTDPSYAANNATATGAVQGVLANPVSASQLSDTNLQPYENPFTSSVISATNTQIGQQRQIAQNQDSAQATAANAFGGSRSGVMGALTNQLYDQDTASTDAGLNQANYTQAQNAAQSDVAAQNAMKQFNTNTALTGATTLSNLNNAALGTAAAQGGILGAVGDAQQAQNQAALTAAYNAYTQGQQLTVEQQQLLNSALGLMPNQQTVNTSGSGSGSSSTTTNPGIAGILGGLGSLAQGAAAFA